MQPINSIGAIILIGLQTMVIAQTQKWKAIGSLVMFLGWVLNIIALFQK